MYYSQLVKTACSIMFQAHRDDLDKGGYPYVFHPFYLATQMDDEASTCTALLHDVIEDHGDMYSFADLERAGFPASVLDALRLLTHAKGVPYMDYVQALAKIRSRARSSAPTCGTTSTPGGSTALRPQKGTLTCRRWPIWRKRNNKKRRTALPRPALRFHSARKRIRKRKILQPQRLQDFLELLPGFGPGTSSLPRMRSTD